MIRKYPEFLSSILQSVSVSLVQHKTLCNYYGVSGACKSLGAHSWQLQAQPGALYLGLCALDVSLGTWRQGGGRLEG